MAKFIFSSHLPLLLHCLLTLYRNLLEALIYLSRVLYLFMLRSIKAYFCLKPHSLELEPENRHSTEEMM